MVLRRRNLYLATAVFGGGYAAVAAASSLNCEDLTAEQLHERQAPDVVFLNDQLHTLGQQHRKSSSPAMMLSPENELVLYKLRSCPYCAVVSSILDYGRVPYREVSVDPITSSGMPPSGYKLVPQLQFTYSPEYKALRQERLKKEGTAVSNQAKGSTPDEGFFVVDSQEIALKLAPSLGLGDEKALQSPEVKEARAWVKNTLVRSSFVTMNGTYSNAYGCFPGLVPSTYHWLPCRLIGAGALHFMAKYMVKPKLLKNNGELLPAACKEQIVVPPTGEEAGDEKKKTLVVQVKKDLPLEQMFTSCCDHFAKEMIPQGSLYHGGTTPNIVDVELYGVLRSVSQQSGPVKHAIDESHLAPWVTRMKSHVPNQQSKTY